MVLKRRHIAKALTYRICSTIVTILVAIAVTGDVKTGLVIGPIDLILKVGLYYWHERRWLRTTWGIKHGN